MAQPNPEPLPNWFEVTEVEPAPKKQSMNTYRESYRTHIKHLRKSRKWSQPVAAKKIGIKAKTLAAYEEGRAEPPFEILVAICDAYGHRDIYGMLTGEGKGT